MFFLPWAAENLESSLAGAETFTVTLGKDAVALAPLRSAARSFRELRRKFVTGQAIEVLKAFTDVTETTIFLLRPQKVDVRPAPVEESAEAADGEAAEADADAAVEADGEAVGAAEDGDGRRRKRRRRRRGRGRGEGAAEGDTAEASDDAAEDAPVEASEPSADADDAPGDRED